MADEAEAITKKTEESKMDEQGGLQKAFILVSADGKVSDKMFGDIEYTKDQKIPVQFNPTEFSIKTTSNYEPKKTGVNEDSDNHSQFKGPAARVLNVKLFYDSIYQKDFLAANKSFGEVLNTALTSIANSIQNMVADGSEEYKKYEKEINLNDSYIKAILGLTRYDTTNSKPINIRFCYGNLAFQGYINTADIIYKRFNAAGACTRAEIILTIVEAGMASEGPKEISIENPIEKNSVIDKTPIDIKDSFSN